MEQKHFRYALIHNHDIRTLQNKEGLDKWAIVECEGFFGKIVAFLIKTNIIKEGCVTSRNNLNGFLNRLLELRVIDRDDKSRYRIQKSYLIECKKIQCNDVLNSFAVGLIDPIELKGTFIHMLYGFPQELIELLNDDEKLNLKKSLKSIEDILSSIKSLRIKYAFRLYIIKVKKLLVDYGNERFRRLFSHPFMCLAYHEGDFIGCDDEMMGYVYDKSIKVPDEIDEYITLEYDSFFDDFQDENRFRKNWGLTFDEYSKVDKLIKTEMNIISDLLGDTPYVYYPKFGKNPMEKNMDEILQVLEGSG